MLIEAENLSKTYDGRVESGAILKEISFAIMEGEFVSIVGPSGSGKSTLMNLIGMLDRATSGSLKFDGEEVSQAKPARLAAIRNADVGFVFQSYNLLPRLSAAANVELPLLYSGCGRANRKLRAMAALDAVGLPHRHAHRPRELSGGEQQRVAIARAIVAEPRLILADEPTGALDTASGRRVMALFEDLNRSGRTVVIVTHDREIAQRAARRLHIRDGALVSDERDSERRRLGIRLAAGAST